MEKYLKIGDYFGGDLSVSSGTRERIVSAQGEVVATTPSPQVARLAVHAINSHDELVAMNKELLAALEAVIEWYDMEADHSIEPDFYKRMASCQVSEDMAREAIAKAKGAA